MFNQFYAQIAQSQEQVNIIYQSDLLHQNFDELLAKQTSNDLAAQRTTKGIHKDELEFTISD